MAERRQRRTSEGQDGRSECPAKGHGHPDPRWTSAFTPVRGTKGCEGQDGRATLKLVPALKPCKATVDDRFGSCSNATQTRC